MIRSIFIDANIVVDWLNADSEKNEECTLLLEMVSTLYRKPLVSPITLAIVYYLINKKVKDPKRLKTLLGKAFDSLKIVSVDEKNVRDTFRSPFLDLEDGLQYHSAMEAGADAIITYNLPDFRYSKLPVLHPQEFIQLHEVN